MKNLNLFFVGTAGCGKTSLCYAFQRWMNTEGLDSVTVNLDPGVEKLPYTPDIDIREWVSLTEIMREHNLGPNGAQIACADLLVFNINKVKDLINEYKTNYVFIDTPGQTELFTFRHASTRIVQTLGSEKSVLIFLTDPFIAQTASGFISELLLASTIQFRFGLPIMNIISKTDMVEPEVLDKLIEWSNDLLKLEEGLMFESQNLTGHLNLGILQLLQEQEAYQTLTPTSSETGLGMEDIYNFVQQIFEGGEDLQPD
jgi:GTPase SAR1 family protein